jgi:predicted nucleic acid-binding protein
MASGERAGSWIGSVANDDGPLIDVAYLDASAAVKLLHEEPETGALVAVVSRAGSCVSSELLEVELSCVARRIGGGRLVQRVGTVLDGIDLLPFTPAVKVRATGPFRPPQRALDAVHLATALDLMLDDLVMLTYDRQQAAAAADLGLPTLRPG